METLRLTCSSTGLMCSVALLCVFRVEFSELIEEFFVFFGHCLPGSNPQDTPTVPLIAVINFELNSLGNIPWANCYTLSPGRMVKKGGSCAITKGLLKEFG